MKKMHSLFVVGLQALWSAVCRSDLKHLRNGITKWLIGFYDRVVYKHQTAYYIPLSINSNIHSISQECWTYNLWLQISTLSIRQLIYEDKGDWLLVNGPK